MSLFRSSLNLPIALLVLGAGLSAPVSAAPLDISQRPLFIQEPAAPLNMLVMGRDHKNYYEAYQDSSDLNGDGVIDTGYKTAANFIYFGYFDSAKCYSYNGNEFVPVSITADKRCGGNWSGDFLNYVTTHRIDALRKVLYGGKRSTDTDGRTILERTNLPPDGHVSGKEYESATRDGYNISDYTPFSTPVANRRHLFVNVSTQPMGPPLLRVLQNGDYRIWNWASIEGGGFGVGLDTCFNAANSPVTCVGTYTVPYPGTPNNRAEMDALTTNFGVAAYRLNAANETPVTGTVNCSTALGGDCNGSATQADMYLAVITGLITINSGQQGQYQFALDGDDATDIEIRDSGGVLLAGSQIGFYGDHALCNCDTTPASSTPVYTLGSSSSSTNYTFTLRRVQNTGTAGVKLLWRKTSGSGTLVANWTAIPQRTSSAINPGGTRDVSPSNAYTINVYNLNPTVTGAGARRDFNVRVEVCRTVALQEDNCRRYPNGNLKPTGLLHDYGENDEMMFGLMTGSNYHNTEGGVLRKNVSSFTNEVDPDTGRWTSVRGVRFSIDQFRILGFHYANYFEYNTNCPDLGTRPLNDGECRMWGNPLAEMMFETLRYFAGAAVATPRYATGGNAIGRDEEGTVNPLTNGEAGMNLPAPAWVNPYAANQFSVCARPFQTLISDINPSYDDGLPGNAFSQTLPDGTTPSTLSTLDVAAQGQTIWNHEFGGSRNIFIGQSAAVSDAAPTVKSASSFGNIRGLSPEEPTKRGSYYAASVARFGAINDLNTVDEAQQLVTYSVALASPLPRIEFPVGTRLITLVPFAKSVSGAFGIDKTTTFQPTNTIVDFYVDRILNLPGQPTDLTVNGGRGYATFRINYEDVEQGNDHDMDAIVRYEIVQNADNTVTVNLTSEYAAGGVNHSIGYIVSGTTADGIYLEVRDVGGTGESYRFNTPAGQLPRSCDPAVSVPTAACNNQLPLTATRTFTAGPSATPSGTLLKDPLWYAAKYGGFDDIDRNGLPNGNSEFDTDNNGIPDNYFLVTNAIGLKQQLSEAFTSIILRNSPSGSVSATGTQINEGSLAFIPEFSNSGNDWYGDVTAYRLTSDGQVLSSNALWKASTRLPAHGSRNIFTVTDTTEASTVAADFSVSGMGGDVATLGLLGQTVADLNADFGLTTAADVGLLVDFLRGDASRERRNGGVFRDRTNVLGDILGSQPVTYIQNFGYTALPTNEGGGLASYGSYLQGKSSRTPMLFVGDNSGMLHGYEATPGANGGREVFAFVPNGALETLHLLAEPAYQHHYYVDSTPAVGDAFIGSRWGTYLVGAMGAGGRSVFAIDVTDPATAFDRSNIKWEVSPDSGTEFQDLGFSFGQPVISLTEMGWVAIFGNGYNSDRGLAALYVMDLASGRLIQKVTLTGDLTDPNGLASVAPVDTDGDLKTDKLYAGDYHGNVWSFTVDASTVSVDYSGRPLFTATDANGVRQPITGGIDVARHHLGGQLVVAGTGRYFLTDDNDLPLTPAVPQTQTIYGLWDKTGDASYQPPVRGDLQVQLVTAADTTFRKVSQNTVDWTTQKGWYLDLVEANGSAVGERFISRPVVRFGKVFLNTFTPTGNSCRPGGKNFQFILAALTGGGDLLLPPGYSFCDTGDCGGITLGVGPPAGIPVLAITQPTSTQCDPSLDPNCNAAPYTPCDESDPTCTTPEPTPGSVLNDRCGFIVNVVPPGSPQVRLARPCGRQSWRQVE